MEGSRENGVKCRREHGPPLTEPQVEIGRLQPIFSDIGNISVVGHGSTELSEMMMNRRWNELILLRVYMIRSLSESFHFPLSNLIL